MAIRLNEPRCRHCGADKISHDLKHTLDDADVPYAGYSVTLLECVGFEAEVSSEAA